MSGRPLFCGAAGALALGASTAAHADPPKPKAYALSWVRLEGAERCIGQRELAASVEELLGRHAFVTATQADRNIEGRVGPRPGGFRATLILSNARDAQLARRDLTIDGPNCRALDEKLKLTLSLLVAPGAEPKATSTGWSTVEPDPDPWDGLPASTEPDPWQDLPASTEPDPWHDLPASTEPDPWHDLPASTDPDPWYQLPSHASARAGSLRGQAARQTGAEGVELSALVGYGMGANVVPIDGTESGGLKLGIGLRGGYSFASGLWLGASYTHHVGGSIQYAVYAKYPVGRGGPLPYETYANSVTAHVPALEIGYSMPAGPFQLRPQIGVGAIVYTFGPNTFVGPFDASGSDGSRSRIDAPGKNGPTTTLAAWPGVALTLPLNEIFFSAEARWGFIAGASASSPLSLFGGAGVRF
jgi:hypothetical protein